jgi:hypothetical protein
MKKAQPMSRGFMVLVCVAVFFHTGLATLAAQLVAPV